MTILWENRKRNSRSLHYAPPDFLLRLVAQLANFMRLSLLKPHTRGRWSVQRGRKPRVGSCRDNNYVKFRGASSEAMLNDLSRYRHGDDSADDEAYHRSAQVVALVSCFSDRNLRVVEDV